MKIIFTKRHHILPLAVMLLMALSGISQNLQISGGNDFSVGLCDNVSGTTVYAWGKNSSGQIGLVGNATMTAGVPYANTPYNVPQPVCCFYVAPETQPRNIKQIDAGSGSHALALDCGGNVWAWGEGACGQIGNGTGGGCGAGLATPTPARVLCGGIGSTNCVSTFLAGAKYVSGGNTSSFALLRNTTAALNGTIAAWGDNADGQLGDLSQTNRTTPVYVKKCSGGNLNNIVQIEGGDACTYALDTFGVVWSWGSNAGQSLGRPYVAANYLTANVSACASPVRMDKNGDNTDDANLTNIKQISGGDTHGLALDSNGNVWSWGGDWGPGQLGQGTKYQQYSNTNEFASKVVAPGACSDDQYKVGPYLGTATPKVVFIAAGQASSSAVLADGSVVTFGANGMFNCPDCSMSTSAGVLGTGTVVASCIKPSNNASCGWTTTNATTPIPAGCPNPTNNPGTSNSTCENGSDCPVYVKVSGVANLGGIVSVSDGDAWYFATTAAGDIYAWGWNRNGELGVGTFKDSSYASKITSMPCAVQAPCAGDVDLGADFTTCPVFTKTLTATVLQVSSTFNYTWDFSDDLGATWTSLGTGTTNTRTAQQVGWYRVAVSDSRSYVSSSCGSCPVVKDTIKIIAQTAPTYTVNTKAYCVASHSAYYRLTSPSTVKWYNDPVLSGASNLLGKGPNLTVDTLQTQRAIAACGGFRSFAVWVQDTSSYQGTLLPAATATNFLCSGGSGAITNSGVQDPLMITAYQNLTITSVDVIIPSHGTNPYSSTYTVSVFDNGPTSGPYCGGCIPVGNQNGPTGSAIASYNFPVALPANSIDLVNTFTLPIAGISLTGSAASPTSYWISVTGGDVKRLDCTPAYAANSILWATQPYDNSGFNVLQANTSIFNNGATESSHLANIKFNVGNPYTCGRYLVCADVPNCTLPVEFLLFTATQTSSGVNLEWSTASEKNSNLFNVERSTDGIHFSTIATVNAAGNSNSILHYSLKDASAATPGLVYYRVVEYDIDGQANYSEIRFVRNKSDNDVKIVPNPSNGNFTVFIEGEENKSINLIVYNTLGQVVYQLSEKNKETAIYSRNIDIQNFASGVYILHVNSSDYTWIKKIIKE